MGRSSGVLEGERRSREAQELRGLLEAYRATEDVLVRERIVEQLLPLVRALARRYVGCGERLEDLVQVGSVGLVEAIDRFDPERGDDFVRFAIPTITGEIRHHLRDRTATVRIPRRLAELTSALRVPRESLTLRLARPPRPSELAREAGVREDEVVDAIGAELACAAPVSLSAVSGDGVVDAAMAVEDAFEPSDDRLLLAAGFRTLPERERRILHLRFYAGLSQDEIAREMGMSQVHVSRLIRASLERMRPVLDADRSTVGV